MCYDPHLDVGIEWDARNQARVMTGRVRSGDVVVKFERHLVKEDLRARAEQLPYQSYTAFYLVEGLRYDSLPDLASLAKTLSRTLANT